MKRNITAMVLFTLLLTVSVLQLLILKNVTERLAGLIVGCERSIETDSNDADERLAALCDYWEEYSNAASFLTRSDALGDMAADVARLGTMTDSAELIGELESLRTRAAQIYDEQVPHPRSVF